jgi:hypothetical protein
LRSTSSRGLSKVIKPSLFFYLVHCGRCLGLYKLGDVAQNRVTLEIYEVLQKERYAREMCDWIEIIEKNMDRVYDVGENSIFFCHKCYILTMRDIELYE